MYISVNQNSNNLWKKLSKLKSINDTLKKKALKKRAAENPHATDLEYLLGAFLESFDPHLKELIIAFSEKGYAIDPISGFTGKNGELQSICGHFSLDYVIKNKFDKLGVKFRNVSGLNCLVFWPDEASLENIVKGWQKVLNLIPNYGKLDEPCSSIQAKKFRRIFPPENINLQSQRSFEGMKYKIKQIKEKELIKRKKENPSPSETELALGLYVEELDSQVREAVLALYKKGYPTDASGFTGNPFEQMIDGDFQLEEDVINKLKTAGARVETNPSGYTRIMYAPKFYKLSDIKKGWNKIIALIPQRKMPASPSMTRKARDFRIKKG